MTKRLANACFSPKPGGAQHKMRKFEAQDVAG